MTSFSSSVFPPLVIYGLYLIYTVKLDSFSTYPYNGVTVNNLFSTVNNHTNLTGALPVLSIFKDYSISISVLSSGNVNFIKLEFNWKSKRAGITSPSTFI